MNAQTSCLIVALVALLLLSHAEGVADENGVCSLLAFVPFTYTFGDPAKGPPQVFPSRGRKLNIGFSHMAAALLAQQHFNQRDATVVPELASFSDCNVTLEFGKSSFMDSGSFPRFASQRLYANSNKNPCAIIGPFNDYPAKELAIMSQAASIPHVIYRSFHLSMVMDFFSRYSSNVFPDMLASSRAVISFLQSKGRTNFIGFLYSLSDSNYQRREALTYEWDTQEIQYVTSAYISPLNLTGGTFGREARTPYFALKRIKESGFRTIVVAMDNTFEINKIAEAAEKLGMNRGEYFWVWYDLFDFNYQVTDVLIRDLIAGSAYIVPVSRADFNRPNDPFSMAWDNQSDEAAERLNLANPITDNRMRAGYEFANGADFFRDNKPEFGSSFIYDAVISTGIGACLAQKNDTNASTLAHVDYIRRGNFTGATGQIRFGNDDRNSNMPGTRDASTIIWGALNVRVLSLNASQPGIGSDVVGAAGTFFEPTDILLPDSKPGEWTKLRDFIYRDGTTAPPALLRDEPEMNYLSQGLRVTGLTLMSVAMFSAILSASWIYAHHKHRLLVASQPVFLYFICFGCLVQASAIFSISFDESNGWTEDQLDSACMATPWLIALGCIIVYASLFTKMFRVHKVLQFSRRAIKIKNVAWPALVLVLLALIILSLWTGIDPLRWERVVIDEITGESIGSCNCSHYAAFLTPLIILMIIPTIMTGAIAWKTRDVDERYTESWWIFLLILLQVEIIVIAAPVVAILRDVSTNGRYIGFTLMLWTFPMSTLSIIMVPKVLAYRRSRSGVDDSVKPKRGQLVGVQVSGVGGKVSGLSNLSSTASPPSPSRANNSSFRPGSDSNDRSSSSAVDASNGDPIREVPMNKSF